MLGPIICPPCPSLSPQPCLTVCQDRQRCALRQSLEDNAALQRRLRGVLESLTRAQQKNGDLIRAVKSVHLQRKLGDTLRAPHTNPCHVSCRSCRFRALLHAAPVMGGAGAVMAARDAEPAVSPKPYV